MRILPVDAHPECVCVCVCARGREKEKRLEIKKALSFTEQKQETHGADVVLLDCDVEQAPKGQEKLTQQELRGLDEDLRLSMRL